MSRWIDADKLYEEMQWGVEHDMYDKPFDYLAEILEAPTISTKEIKYFDEDDSVWKIGRVIVDE